MDGKTIVTPLTPVAVRKELVRAMRLDLVGPDEQLGTLDEVLPQAPARWYLTGFIVPLDAEASQRADEDGNDEVDQAPVSAGVDDATPPEPTSARQRYLPSSIGLSVLVPKPRRNSMSRYDGAITIDARRPMATVPAKNGNGGSARKCCRSNCRKK
jgi:hypothetical protein